MKHGTVRHGPNGADNGDIFAAARRQGWRVERTHHHIRLVPADKTRPIVVTGNRAGGWCPRRKLISDLRRSGLTWPAP
jgi:hypothetical protein